MLGPAVRICEYMNSCMLMGCLIGFCGTVNLSKLIHARGFFQDRAAAGTVIAEQFPGACRRGPALGVGSALTQAVLSSTRTCGLGRGLLALGRSWAVPSLQPSHLSIRLEGGREKSFWWSRWAGRREVKCCVFRRETPHHPMSLYGCACEHCRVGS